MELLLSFLFGIGMVVFCFGAFPIWILAEKPEWSDLKALGVAGFLCLTGLIAMGVSTYLLS